MEKNVLPLTDESGYYEIRLESIGGLGANLAGKLLAELGALYMGLNASAFSSYGSEKKGSPVRAYVRFMEKEGHILRNAPVHQPHLLGIFHEAMAGKYPVFAGIGQQSAIVVNTLRSPQEIGRRYHVETGELFCLDAAGIGREHNCRLNMVMLGALAAASGFLDVEKLEALCKERLGKKYPAQSEANLAGIQGGYEAVRKQMQGRGADQERIGNMREYNVEAPHTTVENLPEAPAGCGLCGMEEPFSDTGFQTAGGINPCPGNSAQNDLSASREGFLPVFHPEKCIHCGLCDTTCPDMVFQFVKEKYGEKEVLVNRGPVYQYCKGCLRCVEICPVAALTSAKESEFWEREERK